MVDMTLANRAGLRYPLQLTICPTLTRSVSRASVAEMVNDSKTVFIVGFGNGVEMVVDPDAVPRAGVGGLRDGGHRFELFDGVGDRGEIHPPALRDEGTKRHRGHLALFRVSAVSLVCSDGVGRASIMPPSRGIRATPAGGSPVPGAHQSVSTGAAITVQVPADSGKMNSSISGTKPSSR